MQPFVIHWFRRDLRLCDNTALRHAVNSGYPVMLLFILDTEILRNLDKDDKRISFIYQAINFMNTDLQKVGAAIHLSHGKPEEIIDHLITKFSIAAVYANHDYEPYALNRDAQVRQLLKNQGISFLTFKDQVVFEKDEVMSNTGAPYTVFTPYSKKWLEKFNDDLSDGIGKKESPLVTGAFISADSHISNPLSDFGFTEVSGVFSPPRLDESKVLVYGENRNYPALDATSRMSVHLRFGTVSVRYLVQKAVELNHTWLNELQWREFFMQILWHFPYLVDKPFRKNYERIQWRNDEEEFRRWCEGETGYPLVDAGMRELNTTGFMHNRVRMVVASFLTKHLLIDWRWGEAWFAKKLLDYELSSNNGNWQWAAGTGCDAAPYFRIFNPNIQEKRFDPEKQYIRKWIPELEKSSYPRPMVEHSLARSRCLEVYKAAVSAS